MREGHESGLQRSSAEDAYRKVLASLSKGLLVQFNTDVPGMTGTPELYVEVAADDGALLTENPDIGIPDWEIHPDGEGRLTLYENADQERSDEFEPVITIEVVGFHG